jgi:hypothetical protein
MPSARELSIGITKLSGSNPFLKVAMATAKEIITIMKTAIMFVVSKSKVKLKPNATSLLFPSSLVFAEQHP